MPALAPQKNGCLELLSGGDGRKVTIAESSNIERHEMKISEISISHDRRGYHFPPSVALNTVRTSSVSSGS